MFKNCKHIKVVLSRYESDYSMAKYADELIQNGTDPDDISIISRDSDMYLLNNRVSIQSYNQMI